MNDRQYKNAEKKFHKDLERQLDVDLSSDWHEIQSIVNNGVKYECLYSFIKEVFFAGVRYGKRTRRGKK